MKIRLSSRGLFLLGFIVLIAANIIVLSGVASNRSGEPESRIILTERELQLPYRVHEENSGLALRLTWRALDKVEDNRYYYTNWRSPIWLNGDKLKELKFKIDNYLNSNRNKSIYKQSIPKEVFIVLENDGEAYREAVKRAEAELEKEERLLKLKPGDKKLRDNYESAEKRLKRERATETRLFAIDAGLEPKILRKKYNDRTRFIITKGIVEPRYYNENNVKKVSGHITDLSVTGIHVPLKHRKALDDILVQNKKRMDKNRPPSYEITMAYGCRWEPWIVSVQYMGNKTN